MVQESPTRSCSSSNAVDQAISTAANVVTVEPEVDGALEAAVREATPGTTLVLQAGSYRLKSTLVLSNSNLSIVAERVEGSCAACIVGSHKDLNQTPLIKVNSSEATLFFCNIKLQYEDAQPSATAPHQTDAAACLVTKALKDLRMLDCEFTCPNGRGADLKGKSAPVFDQCFFSKCSM
eukprot:3225042-Rhodomonas_salina.3